MESTEKRALSLDELEAEVAVELPDRELMGGTFVRVTNTNNNMNNNTNTSVSALIISVGTGGGGGGGLLGGLFGGL